MKKLLSALFLFWGAITLLHGFPVAPADALIVVPPGSSGIVRFAAQELSRHLAMMTGRKIPIVHKTLPGKYIFLFAPLPGAHLAPEEARWEVSRTMTRIYGDSDVKGTQITLSEILSPRRRTGDLSAVYAFLEQQLKFLFLAPGDRGSCFAPSGILDLTEGKYRWAPGRLRLRQMRSDCSIFRSQREKTLSAMPPSCRQRYKRECAQKDYETALWLKKQRQGSSFDWEEKVPFRNWWQLYGKSHPEFFALLERGRKPAGDPAQVKMCVSNPRLAEKIIEVWKNTKPRPRTISICENEAGGGFCSCENCRKLDLVPPGGRGWEKDLTDRYIFLANAVARSARKIDPQTTVIFHASGIRENPPRRFRVEPNVLVVFTPDMLDLKEVRELYSAWRRAGAVLLFQRPRDLHYGTGLFMGMEKRLFEHFQTGYRSGITGSDYDGLHRFWGSAGPGDYILARAHIYPEKSFDEHLNEYCSAFGEAAGEVRSCFEYWRKEFFENRLLPNKETITALGRGDFRKGFMVNQGKYLFDRDFEMTGRILERAMERKLTWAQQELLSQLIVANYHSRLICRAVTAPDVEKLLRARDLLRFRMTNWSKLDMDICNLWHLESEAGDITGILRAVLLGTYENGLTLQDNWYHAPDPGNRLTARKVWLNFDHALHDWQRLPEKGVPAEQTKVQKGSTWYTLSLKIPAEWQNRKIALIFSALNDSAWVYLNGRLCSSRICTKEHCRPYPFAVPIDEHINWRGGEQRLFLRLENTRGGRLIFPVLLVCGERK